MIIIFIIKYIINNKYINKKIIIKNNNIII